MRELISLHRHKPNLATQHLLKFIENRIRQLATHTLLVLVLSPIDSIIIMMIQYAISRGGAKALNVGGKSLVKSIHINKYHITLSHMLLSFF